jgi:anthranilate synthase component 1
MKNSVNPVSKKMLDLQPPNYEAFVQEARHGNVVPVVRSVLADLHTPVGAFMRIAGDSPYAFLLESVGGGERIARYSFLGAEPEIVVRGRGFQTFIERNGVTQSVPMLATEWVRDYFRQRSLARRPGLVPFAGGAVGFVGYDAAQWFEPALRDKETQPLDGPTDALWMFYRTVIAFDRVKQRLEIVSIVLTEEAQGSHTRLRELYDEAVARTLAVEKSIFEGDALPARPPIRGQNTKISLQSNWTRRAFEDGVRRIEDHIAAGDCYQVVLSQRFSTKFTGEALQIYRALRAINPSPYMFFLRAGEEAVIGASPEMLVRCHGQRLDYRPIAGTLKRGATDT